MSELELTLRQTSSTPLERLSVTPGAEACRGWRLAMVLTRSDTIAGGQVHVRDLSKALIARGHEVTVLVGGSGPFIAELEKNKIPFRSVPALVRELDPIRDARALVQLRRHLKELQPDLVTTHSSKAGWLGRLAGRSLRLPVIFTAHGWAFTPGINRGASAFYRVAEKVAATFTSRIITVAEHDRKLALSKGVGRPGQLVTIYNGIPRGSQALRAVPEREPPRVIHAG